VQKSASQYLKTIEEYRENRVSVEKELSRCVYVDDFHRAHDHLSTNQFVDMRKAVCELRDHYASMYDYITKNWRLITQPRTQDTMPFMF